MAGGEGFWQPLNAEGATFAENVRDAGRWEVVVSGVPAEAVTNEAEDDWLYAWAGA